MAALPPSRLSRAQLQAHIRAVAADSDRVFFTNHALARMKDYAVGVDIAAVVAVSDDDPDLVVITAMPTGN